MDTQLITSFEKFQEIIKQEKENYGSFFCTWRVTILNSVFDVGPDDVVKVYGEDEDENEFLLCYIPTSLAKELSDRRMLYFNDISWGDNELYIYSLREERVLLLEE